MRDFVNSVVNYFDLALLFEKGGRTGYFVVVNVVQLLYKENKGLKLKNKEITSNQYGKNNYQWKGECRI